MHSFSLQLLPYFNHGSFEAYSNTHITRSIVVVVIYASPHRLPAVPPHSIIGPSPRHFSTSPALCSEPRHPRTTWGTGVNGLGFCETTLKSFYISNSSLVYTSSCHLLYTVIVFTSLPHPISELNRYNAWNPSLQIRQRTHHPIPSPSSPNFLFKTPN